MPHARLRSVLLLAWAPLAVALALVLAGVFALVGLPWWAGVIIGLLAAAVIVLLAVRGAADRLLGRLGATPLEADAFPHYDNLVEGLALSTGLAEPDLYTVSDPALNGAALACGHSNAIVVTTGLLESCDRMELEAVLAGLLSRIKSGDAEAATVISALFGRPVLESGLGSFLTPIVDRASRNVFDEHREIASDREAVAVTRYPPGLSAALERIMSGPYEPAGTTAGTELLWFAPPSSAPLAPHSPLPWRLDVLSET